MPEWLTWLLQYFQKYNLIVSELDVLSDDEGYGSEYAVVIVNGFMFCIQGSDPNPYPAKFFYYVGVTFDKLLGSRYMNAPTVVLAIQKYLECRNLEETRKYMG